MTLSTEFATDQESIEGDVPALICCLGIVQVGAGFVEVIASVRDGADGGYRSVRASQESVNVGRVAAMADRIDGQALAVHLTEKQERSRKCHDVREEDHDVVVDCKDQQSRQSVCLESRRWRVVVRRSRCLLKGERFS